MNKKHKEHICTCMLMVVGMSLLVIMTRIVYGICVQGKSVEIITHYEPVCYCLMVLLVAIGILSYLEAWKNE